MFDLTNREAASIILLVAFIGLLVAVPTLRRQLESSIPDVLKAFFVWKIQVPLLIYFVYATGVIYLAWRLSVWDSSQLKDTIIVVFFVGLPLLFGANKVEDGKKFIRDVVRDVAGISALLTFYINLVSFPLLGELLIQLFAILLSLVAVVARQKPEYRSVGKFANSVLALVGIALIVHTAWVIMPAWRSDDWFDVVKSLSLSIWLPLVLIPLVYVFAFIMHVEVILVVLPFFNDKKKPKFRVRIVGIWGLHFSTRLASEFNGTWRSELAQSDSFRGAYRVMKEFRKALRMRDRAMKAYEERLESMTGVPGVDSDGLMLDRREFYATKEALTKLHFMQMGWYRNQGGAYRPELLEIFGDLARQELPAEHGIQLVVSKNKQTWRAWRQTPSGWYFGVGGTTAPLHQWQYDGSTPPLGFPSERAKGWVNATLNPSSPEWAKDDAPPMRI